MWASALANEVLGTPPLKSPEGTAGRSRPGSLAPALGLLSARGGGDPADAQLKRLEERGVCLVSATASLPLSCASSTTFPAQFRVCQCQAHTSRSSVNVC